MGLSQIYKLLYSKGNSKQNEKTTYRTGENICKLYEQQALNFQNIQTVYTISKKQTTQLKNGQKS